MNIENRIIYLDAIKAVLIFLVIWGHSIQYTNITEDLSNPIASFIYSFHMPMFMAISGIFFHKVLSKNYKTAIKEKSIQLLLPSTLLLLLLFSAIFIHKPRSLQDSLFWLWIARPWYVYTLFACIIASYICIRLTPKTHLGFLLAFCFFCLIPDISAREIFMLPYFALGYYWNLYKNYITPQYENITLVSSTIFYGVLMLTYFNSGGYDIYHSPWILWTVKNFSLANCDINVAVIRFLTGLTGTVSIFLFLKKIFSTSIGINFCKCFFVSFVGRNTLGLYLYQIAIFTVYMGFANEVTRTLSYGRSYLPPLISVVILLLLTFIIKVIRKSKTLTYFLLGEYKK